MRLPCRRVRRPGTIALVLTLLAGLGLSATPAAAQDELENLLTEVGREYARAYMSPVVDTFGPNLNSGLFTTAAIPQSRLTFSIGVRAMATRLNEADQAFQRVLTGIDLGTFDPAYAGQTGTVVMAGPTVFGDTGTMGRVTGYIGGIQVFEQDAIEGLADTRWSPLAAPELSVGGIAGLRATIRYLPEVDLGDIGKTKFFGYGLQWNANGVLTALPVDVMIGFFRQSLDIGTVVEADASSVFLAVSRDLPLLTVYGGFAVESSDMTVSYTYTGGTVDRDISFDVDGIQENRVTLGATLNVLSRLNIEMGLGDVTTYSAGLLFGL